MVRLIVIYFNRWGNPELIANGAVNWQISGARIENLFCFNLFSFFDLTNWVCHPSQSSNAYFPALNGISDSCDVCQCKYRLWVLVATTMIKRINFVQHHQRRLSLSPCSMRVPYYDRSKHAIKSLEPIGVRLPSLDFHWKQLWRQKCVRGKEKKGMSISCIYSRLCTLSIASLSPFN